MTLRELMSASAQFVYLMAFTVIGFDVLRGLVGVAFGVLSTFGDLP